MYIYKDKPDQVTTKIDHIMSFCSIFSRRANCDCKWSQMSGVRFFRHKSTSYPGLLQRLFNTLSSIYIWSEISSLKLEGKDGVIGRQFQSLPIVFVCAVCKECSFDFDLKNNTIMWCLWCYSECISTPGELEKYARPRWESNLRPFE